MKKLIAILLTMVLLLGVSFTLTGCMDREADRVSYNVSQEADNFNVLRRLSVINMRSDKPIFEMTGFLSIKTDSMDNQLEVTVEVSDGNYKKHFVYLNDWTMYVVEDISGADVNKYKYQVNFLPEMIVPIEFTSND